MLIAPSGEVQNLTVIEVSSRGMVVSWSSPVTDLQNGVIISYRVVVTRTGSNAVLNITTESIQYSISNVFPYVIYTVSVSAINTAGEGPSTSINQTTGSEGNYT